MNPEFVYSPLAEDDGIRLLVLQPAIARDETLSGSLQEISLAQHYDDLIEPFTALSYVWGDPTPVDKILLDNRELGITANLSAALRDLRDTSRSYKLWVDAICINQDNIPERNKQVGLMGKIYSGANNTVIYLGQLNPYITAIIDLVNQQVHSSTSGAISVNPRIPYGDSGSEISLIDAMHKGLLPNPWFRRIWVLQELVLSREPWVQCGTNRVRWQDLCRLLAPQLGRHRRNEEGSKELTALESMNKIRLDYWGITGASSSDDPLKMSNSSSDNTLDDDSPDPRRRLWQILQSRKGSEVSDARDIIFGHMGVISDRRRAEKFIKIDYNLTISEVLAAAGRYIYYCRGMDTMLSGITSSPLRESAALPTWVPGLGNGRRSAARKPRAQSNDAGGFAEFGSCNAPSNSGRRKDRRSQWDPARAGCAARGFEALGLGGE
ncbi:hypothetical protein NUW58_g6031 [Xylaria curta]|uniref:Uncharacterized protein n=1 Tax=Xylaria curta TaxID=42375 RepID=A0ACC1NYW1_9PEZI|nr:hypothetical protein NUW58_g6031 [Xylaria curta]